jgi:hypothetical protein
MMVVTRMVMAAALPALSNLLFFVMIHSPTQATAQNVWISAMFAATIIPARTVLFIILSMRRWQPA